MPTNACFLWSDFANVRLHMNVCQHTLGKVHRLVCTVMAHELGRPGGAAGRAAAAGPAAAAQQQPPMRVRLLRVNMRVLIQAAFLLFLIYSVCVLMCCVSIIYHLFYTHPPELPAGAHCPAAGCCSTALPIHAAVCASAAAPAHHAGPASARCCPCSCPTTGSRRSRATTCSAGARAQRGSVARAAGPRDWVFHVVAAWCGVCVSARNQCNGTVQGGTTTQRMQRRLLQRRTLLPGRSRLRRGGMRTKTEKMSIAFVRRSFTIIV